MNNYRLILTYESGRFTDIEYNRQNYLSIYSSNKLLELFTSSIANESKDIL